MKCDYCNDELREKEEYSTIIMEQSRFFFEKEELKTKKIKITNIMCRNCSSNFCGVFNDWYFEGSKHKQEQKAISEGREE